MPSCGKTVVKSRLRDTVSGGTQRSQVGAAPRCVRARPWEKAETSWHWLATNAVQKPHPIDRLLSCLGRPTQLSPCDFRPYGSMWTFKGPSTGHRADGILFLGLA